MSMSPYVLCFGSVSYLFIFGDSCQITHTHTHPFNGTFSRTTRVGRYQKAKPFWILLKQETVRGSGISWAYASLHLAPDRITTPAPHHSDQLSQNVPD